MPNTDPQHEIRILVTSHFPLVFIETSEEQRATHLVREALAHGQAPILTWSVTQGLVGPDGAAVGSGTEQPVAALQVVGRVADPAVVLLYEFAQYLDDAATSRHLRELAAEGRHTLVVIDASCEIPEQLRPMSVTYALPRPDLEQIRHHAETVISQMRERGRARVELSDEDLDQLVASMRGLTLHEVDTLLGRLAAHDGRLSVEDLERAVHEKSRLLATTGVVELVVPDVGLDWVAGFDDLKRWIATRQSALAPDAAEFGLAPPRGFMLTGVPGCGKSMVVKALAKDWNMPLLRLDAGSLFDKYIGSTERNLRDALQMAEALAPSILWIDEIEKAFSITEASSSDGGLGFRMVGTLATWMQERREMVFLAATSNDISKLPPELTRQGRFDEIFFVDLPEAHEREALFSIHLARRNRDPAAFDCVGLARHAEGFSGAEVEQAIVNALYAAYADGVDIDTTYIAREIEATRPLSRVSPEKIGAIRSWGAAHARAV